MNSRTELFVAWQTLIANTEGRLPAFIAAEKLGVSEATLLLSQAESVLLTPVLEILIPAMAALGTCMAMTRHPEIVLESRGQYQSFQRMNAQQAQISGNGIELLIDPTQWHSAIAIIDATPHGPRCGIHFFNPQGHAVHKTYMYEKNAEQRYQTFINAYKLPSQVLTMSDTSAQSSPPFNDDAKRTIHRIEIRALVQILEAVVANKIPIALTVHCYGCSQTHRGPIQSVKETAPWFNIFDKYIHCHMRLEDMGQAYIDPATAALIVCREDHSVMLNINSEQVNDTQTWKTTLAALTLA